MLTFLDITKNISQRSITILSKELKMIYCENVTQKIVFSIKMNRYKTHKMIHFMFSPNYVIVMVKKFMAGRFPISVVPGKMYGYVM